MSESLEDRLEKCTSSTSGTVFRALFAEVRELEAANLALEGKVGKYRTTDNSACSLCYGKRLIISELEAEWDRLREAEWTQDVPVKAGWYWHYHKNHISPEVVRISGDAMYLVDSDDMHVFYANQRSCLLSLFTATEHYWSLHPIPAPSAAEKEEL